MRRLLASLCAAACLIVASLVLAPVSGAATPVVRELRRQCHAGGFGRQYRRFERENGYLPAHHRRLAGAEDRHSHPRRFGGHGAAGQERGAGHPDGRATPSTPLSARRPIPVGDCRIRKSGPTTGGAATTIAPPSTACRCARRRSARSVRPTSENLQIPQYKHAVVMGVNKNKIPGGGAAFFFHTTDGAPPRAAWRSTMPRWCRLSVGCGPAR